MSVSNIKDILSSRRRMVAAAAWMLVLVAALSAATYAWFSNSRYTNVTPVAHTVSDEGADLLIATTVAPEGLTCPYVSGVPFMTGMNRVAAEKAVLDVMAQ